MERADELLLEVADFRDLQHWRWVLKESSGKFLQDQEVSLDPADPNYRALIDLQTYLDHYSSPDNRTNEQLKLLDQIGIWIAQNIFGQIGPIILDNTPVTVRICLPKEASSIMYLPLELARLDDRPLSLNDVSLVFQEASQHGAEKITGDRLRILCVFSLPTDASALALRRERYQLMKLIEGIAQNHGFAIEIRVLQYGSTRETLREVLAEEDGWDMIHFSGHGDRAILVLEREDGTKDPINSQDLQRLLRRTKHRVKMITLSSCLSAAATLKETLGWLGLSKPELISEVCEIRDKDALPSMASALVKDLDCAVLAMRYIVGDEFAINLAQELYEGMLGRKQALTSALQFALPKILDDYNAATPPLSMATPALFGERAASLILEAPKKAFEAPQTPLAHFPNEPKRFVGRTSALGRSNKALAHRSDMSGVLFYGMAGAGKTACALELAYHYSRSRRFGAFVWYQAPKEGDDISAALRNLALAIENQVPGFKMIHVVDREKDFEAWLPHLTETLERTSILMVLDNLESLLTKEGTWRDERWSKLITAMLSQEGESKVILTSRLKPIDLADKKIHIESIHALSLDEAVLLAREMPYLGKMLLEEPTGGGCRGRELVARTLSVVQGHPKLIELADAMASNPKTLADYLATEPWVYEDSRLKSFFDKGESSLDENDFLEMLYSWTKATSASLAPASRLLFQFLCSLEGPDRQRWIVEQVWPSLWKRLGPAGQAPCIEEFPPDLKALVDVQATEKGFRYVIHLGVAEAGLEELKQGFRAMVDEEMICFWRSLFDKAMRNEMEGAGSLVVLAGLSVTPYLIRLNMWNEAAYRLEHAIARASSPSIIFAVLPTLRRIANATNGTMGGRRNAGILSNALQIVGLQQEAEARIRSLISECVEHGEFRTASAAAANLSTILLNTGRAKESLELMEVKKSYNHKAGIGPWTQLLDDIRRLQAMNLLGHYSEVLEAANGIWVQIESMPEQSKQDEAVSIWNVKELVLDTGRTAAMRSESYNQALELNATLLELKMDRGVSELELARTAFTDYFPLIRLGRHNQAEKLLWNCKNVFDEEKDVKYLGKVFAALADLEYGLGHIDEAIKLENAAMRYSYLSGDTEDISIIHNNMGTYLLKAGSEKALAHHLAAGIIFCETDSGLLPSALHDMLIDLHRFGPLSMPANFDQLCLIVGAVEGVIFRDLLQSLAGPKADGDQVMQKIIEMAKEAGYEREL